MCSVGKSIEILLSIASNIVAKKGLELFAYVIMTNHVHVIMRSKDGKLSDVVRDFKKHTSKLILELISSSTKESRREWLEMVFKYHAKFNKRAGERQL